MQRKSRIKATDQRWKDILSGAAAGLAGAIAILSGAGILDPALLDSICGVSPEVDAVEVVDPPAED